MTPGSAREERQLRAVLGEARDLGFLGPGDVEPHVEHARGFVRACGRTPSQMLDMGAGGGVPGLVLAMEWPNARGVLLDAGARRAEFLEEACRALGIEARISVVCARAEDAARNPLLRGHFDLVTARSFGAPAVTAECAAGFLQVGGHLVVSEPPDDGERRWPDEGLATLGFGPVRRWRDGAGYAVLELMNPAADRWPRRTGIPAKRPLWT